MSDDTLLALDLVSPLPPVRTGIADYTIDLLRELERVCDVRLVRVDGQEVSPEIVERWHPAPMSAIGEKGRLPFYQMGNNLHHERILELALERPGIVTLHDLYLHHLLIERTLARGEIEPYREWLAFDHGWVGAAVAEPPRWGAYGTACLFALPCHRRLVLGQRGVLVHSRWAAERLLEDVPEANVRVVPMPMPLEPQAQTPGTAPTVATGGGAEPSPASRARGAAARQRWGIPAGAPLLGSFGFQTPIKRTDVVIAALTRPELDDAHLLVVGNVARAYDLEGVARELGVAPRVHVAGYLDRHALAEAMAAADLCVNLRYPTAGETSASLLRLLALGRPTLVSDYAQFTDLPRDAVAHVPIGDGEVEALAAVAGRLLAHPEELEELGRRAREHVRREHDPALAAGRIADACRELLEVPPRLRAPRPARVPLPTSLTWGHLSGELEVEGAERPWPEGEFRRLRLRVRNTGQVRWLAGNRGDGGVAFEVRLLRAESPERSAEETEKTSERPPTETDVLRGRPWPALAVDLEPGAEITIDLQLRRPPGPARLSIEPHVLGVAGARALGGPTWQAEL